MKWKKPGISIWASFAQPPVSFFTIRSLCTPGRNAARTIALWPLTFVLSVLAATPLTGLSALGAGEWVGVLAGIAGGMILERATSPPARSGLKGVAPDGTILS